MHISYSSDWQKNRTRLALYEYICGDLGATTLYQRIITACLGGVCGLSELCRKLQENIQVIHWMLRHTRVNQCKTGHMMWLGSNKIPDLVQNKMFLINYNVGLRLANLGNGNLVEICFLSHNLHGFPKWATNLSSLWQPGTIVVLVSAN